MSGNPGILAVEQGCAIIEGQIQGRFDEIRSGVSEIVDPFIAGLPKEIVAGFDVIARNLIVGVDRPDSDESRALMVASRTYGVAQLIICKTVTHPPIFNADKLIDSYIDLAHAGDQGRVNINKYLCSSFERSTHFSAIMREFHPSINPEMDEPEVFSLFGGYVLQSAAIGEYDRVKAELEDTVANLTNFEGDLRELFEK